MQLYYLWSQSVTVIINEPEMTPSPLRSADADGGKMVGGGGGIQGGRSRGDTEGNTAAQHSFAVLAENLKLPVRD